MLAMLLVCAAPAVHAHQAKINFLNQLSHDIRKPMNAMIGFSSLATSHLENEQLLENDLKKVIVSSRHLLATLDIHFFDEQAMREKE